MANIISPVPYLTRRELGLVPDIKSHFFNNRLNAARNLYRRDLVCHYGCVNAIEFSNNGELLVSGIFDILINPVIKNICLQIPNTDFSVR